MKFIDMVGQQFGQLLVLELHSKTMNGKAIWLCECACGGTCKTVGTDLRSGHTRSCGCLAGRSQSAASEPSQKTGT